MIHQALAHALKPHQNWNAQFLQMPDWADAGAQQMRRRMDRAARQHDLAAAEFLLVSIDQRFYANASLAFEQELAHLCVSRDRQVGALARLAIKIAHCRRDASLFLIGVRDWKVAVSELGVLVRQKG